jgi:hypothetical protein
MEESSCPHYVRKHTAGWRYRKTVAEYPPAPGGSDKVDTEEADEIIAAQLPL